MSGKDRFTLEEIEKLKLFVKGYRRATTGTETKKFRGKMRSVGFYVSDFGIENIEMGKFQALLKSGRIRISEQGSQLANSKSQVNFINETFESKVSNSNLDEILCNGKFTSAKDLDKSANLNCTGFYCIRLKEGSELPEKYQKHLDQRSNRIIYIGKAEGQTLKKRFLGQELRAKGHGTFFRSIGAVLGYFPEKGSLCDYKNKKNYKFSPAIQEEIIYWINSNLEVSWIAYNGNFAIEKTLISKYFSLLNDTYNPKKLTELAMDKAHCRLIANQTIN